MTKYLPFKRDTQRKLGESLKTSLLGIDPIYGLILDGF